MKAMTGSSKRIPIVKRQRSSIRSHEGSLNESTMPPAMIRSASDQSARSIALPRDTSATQLSRRSRASSPHPGKRKTSIAEPSDRSAGGRDTGSEAVVGGSVSPVKTRFKENDEGSSNSSRRMPPSHRSFTHLPSALLRSSAAAPAAASYQASGMMTPDVVQVSSGKGKEAFREDVVPLKGPGPAADANTRTPPVSPRSRSQLALLLDKGKAPLEERRDINPPESKRKR